MLYSSQYKHPKLLEAHLYPYDVSFWSGCFHCMIFLKIFVLYSYHFSLELVNSLGDTLWDSKFSASHHTPSPPIAHPFGFLSKPGFSMTVARWLFPTPQLFFTFISFSFTQKSQTFLPSLPFFHHLFIIHKSCRILSSVIIMFKLFQICAEVGIFSCWLLCYFHISLTLSFLNNKYFLPFWPILYFSCPRLDLLTLMEPCLYLEEVIGV